MTERIEEKFFIPVRLRPSALDLIQSRLRPAYPDPSTRYTWIRSVYFDTETLDLFTEHFSSPRDRFKLRTRRYGPNGLWDRGKGVVELKKKMGDVSSKTRIELAPRELDRLHRGEVPALGPIGSLIMERGLRPVCSVTYRRFAFEGPGGLRVTLDEGLRFSLVAELDGGVVGPLLRGEAIGKALEMRRRFHERECVLLEVKRKRPAPDWICRFLREGSTGDLGFSKYCYSIAGALDAIPR